MPALRKVDPTEAAAWVKGTVGNKGARKAVHAQYDAMIADFAVGDYAGFDLADGEKSLAVKNQVKAAAARRGMDVKFLRGKKNLVKVEFVAKAATAADAPTDPA